MSHPEQIAPALERAQLAEVDLWRVAFPEVGRLAQSAGDGRDAKRLRRAVSNLAAENRNRNGGSARAAAVLRQGRITLKRFEMREREAARAGIEAAESIELALASVLAPLANEGLDASIGLEMNETAFRLAIVNVLGWDAAAAARKKAGKRYPPATPSRKGSQLLICRGNPLFGQHERFDRFYARGCRAVYRGQWRPGREGIALGPRCDACRARMSEDLRAWQEHRATWRAEHSRLS